MTFLDKLANEIYWFNKCKELKCSKFLKKPNHMKSSKRMVLELKTKSKNDLIDQLIIVDKIVSQKFNLVGFSFDKNDQRKNKIILRKYRPLLQGNYSRTGYEYHNWIEFSKGYKYGGISINNDSNTLFYSNVGTIYMYKKLFF